MKRVLLLLLALLAALALLILEFARRPAALGAPPPPTELPAVPEPVRGSVQLSYVELAASPHRTEQPGATQVFGWLARADDGQPVRSGTLRLRSIDYASSSESAIEEHARALAIARMPRGIDLKVRVQEDGGWYADLPGKAWIDSAEYTPDPAGADPQGQTAGGARLARTGVGIDLPLERGALELSFRVDLALDARGIVVDELGSPVAGAQVRPRMSAFVTHSATSAQDGGFLIAGIAPQDLIVENGLVRFEVQLDGYETTKRMVAWEAGQTILPPFRVVLQHKTR